MIRNLLDPPDGHTLAAALQRELVRDAGLGRGLSLAFIDIDRFTQFNAAHGWDRGTQVIEAIASVLARIPGCPAGGWIGGDAFAVVLAGVSASEARQTMQRASTVIGDVARTSHICRAHISISVGGVTAARRCAVRVIMRDAHGQLMSAKHAGGGRVAWTMASPHGPYAAGPPLIRRVDG